jgi:hypothetical protein
MIQIQINTPFIMLICILALIFSPIIQLFFILIIAGLVDLIFYILRKLTSIIERIIEVIVYLSNNKYFILFSVLYICYYLY